MKFPHILFNFCLKFLNKFLIHFKYSKFFKFQNSSVPSKMKAAIIRPFSMWFTLRKCLPHHMATRTRAKKRPLHGAKTHTKRGTKMKWVGNFDNKLSNFIVLSLVKSVLWPLKFHLIYHRSNNRPVILKNKKF